MAIENNLDKSVDDTQYHNKYVHKILNLIEQSALTPKDYARMKDEYSEEPLKAKELEEVRLHIKILEQSIEIAAQEGNAKGKAEGKAEGEYHAKLAIARNSKKLGLPIAQIAMAMGLTEAEINNLSEI